MKKSNKEHNKKSQFTKSISIDLRRVEQIQFCCKHQYNTSIEASSSDSDSNSEKSDSDSDIYMCSSSQRYKRIKINHQQI